MRDEAVSVLAISRQKASAAAFRYCIAVPMWLETICRGVSVLSSQNLDRSRGGSVFFFSSCLSRFSLVPFFLNAFANNDKINIVFLPLQSLFSITNVNWYYSPFCLDIDQFKYQYIGVLVKVTIAMTKHYYLKQAGVGEGLYIPRLAIVTISLYFSIQKVQASTVRDRRNTVVIES